MDPFRIDRIAKQFAGRRFSRRQALTTGGAGLAAASLAAVAGFATGSAQDATPDAGANDAILDVVVDPDAPVDKTTFLFVQTYQAGTITPTEGVDGRYTLTLEQGHGQTIYFSDRPDRIVGANPTPQFLEGLGFPDDNPPNAALVVETAPGETDVAVVELFNPLYDPETQGVTYEIEVLGNWQAELEMEFHEAPTDLATLAPSFGSAQLFIDDCADGTVYCVAGTKRVGNFDDWAIPFCYKPQYATCHPCIPDPNFDLDALNAAWTNACNSHYHDECNGIASPLFDEMLEPKWVLLALNSPARPARPARSPARATPSFDRIARLFAGRRLSRRRALTTGGAGFAATSLTAPAE